MASHCMDGPQCVRESIFHSRYLPLMSQNDYLCSGFYRPLCGENIKQLTRTEVKKKKFLILVICNLII